MPRKPSSKQQILDLFLNNLGRVLESKEIQDAAAGAVEWARRVRELRNEGGYQILTHNDRSDLKPNQYLLETTTRKPAFKRGVSARTRAWVLERNGFTCQMCGAGAGEPDQNNPGRMVRLHIGHIVDQSHGGSDEPSNLRALCSTCNQGAKNLAQEPPSWTWLLGQLRRASGEDQRKALEWLQNKFRK